MRLKEGRFDDGLLPFGCPSTTQLRALLWLGYLLSYGLPTQTDGAAFLLMFCLFLEGWLLSEDYGPKSKSKGP
jgi:hypothetical protein